jgi:hypothetical protein
MTSEHQPSTGDHQLVRCKTNAIRAEAQLPIASDAGAKKGSALKRASDSFWSRYPRPEGRGNKNQSPLKRAENPDAWSSICRIGIVAK